MKQDFEIVILDDGPFLATVKGVMPAIVNAATLALDEARQVDQEAGLAQNQPITGHPRFYHNAKKTLVEINFKTSRDKQTAVETWRSPTKYAVFVVPDSLRNMVHVMGEWHNATKSQNPKTYMSYDANAITSNDLEKELGAALVTAIRDMVASSS